MKKTIQQWFFSEISLQSYWTKKNNLTLYMQFFWSLSIWTNPPPFQLLSVTDNSGQMHLAAVRLNWNGLYSNYFSFTYNDQICTVYLDIFCMYVNKCCFDAIVTSKVFIVIPRNLLKSVRKFESNLDLRASRHKCQNTPNFYIVSEALMLRNHYFSGFFNEKKNI